MPHNRKSALISLSSRLLWKAIGLWLSFRARRSILVQWFLSNLAAAPVVFLLWMPYAIPASWQPIAIWTCHALAFILLFFLLAWVISLCDAMASLAKSTWPTGSFWHQLRGLEANHAPHAIEASRCAAASGWKFPGCPSRLECSLVIGLSSPQALAHWQEKQLQSTPAAPCPPRLNGHRL